MNRNQRATRNTPANKPFISGGVISNFTGATQIQPETMIQVPAPVPNPASVSFSCLHN